MVIRPEGHDFTIMEVNDAILNFFDVKKEQIIGQRLSEWYPGHSGDLNNNTLARSLEQVIRTGKEHSIIIQGYKFSADLINEQQYKSRNTPLLNENGEVEYIIHVIEQVADQSTIRKLISRPEFENGNHAEIYHQGEEFQDINTKLNNIVEALSRQLENANEELDSFSYSVSHDLKSPLRIISGFSDLLLAEYQNKLDDEGRQYLSIVNREVKHMDRLLDDLLTFSRLSRAEITGRVFPMVPLVRECIENVLENSSLESPELVVKDLPNVAANPELLRQVWLNLIGNAVKYRKENQKLHINIGSIQDDKIDRVIFYVKDDGIGFNMKYADKLFGVFQRLHNDNEFEGSGIGLATVRRIINLYGGDVWADSEVDRGSTFYFSMPVNYCADNG